MRKSSRRRVHASALPVVSAVGPRNRLHDLRFRRRRARADTHRRGHAGRARPPRGIARPRCARCALAARTGADAGNADAARRRPRAPARPSGHAARAAATRCAGAMRPAHARDAQRARALSDRARCARAAAGLAPASATGAKGNARGGGRCAAPRAAGGAGAHPHQARGARAESRPPQPAGGPRARLRDRRDGRRRDRARRGEGRARRPGRLDVCAGQRGRDDHQGSLRARIVRGGV